VTAPDSEPSTDRNPQSRSSTSRSSTMFTVALLTRGLHVAVVQVRGDGGEVNGQLLLARGPPLLQHQSEVRRDHKPKISACKTQHFGAREPHGNALCVAIRLRVGMPRGRLPRKPENVKTHFGAKNPHTGNASRVAARPRVGILFYSHQLTSPPEHACRGLVSTQAEPGTKNPSFARPSQQVWLPATSSRIPLVGMTPLCTLTTL